jgi:abequosyltransferase
MSAATLTFCIPIFNCGAYVASALDSILCQLEPGVDIVLLDGGSTDGTPEVLEPFLQANIPIRYVRLDLPGGIDADLNACVSLATGDYCWLLSGDDALMPGALRACMSLIETGRDVYICRHLDCDKEMQPRGVHAVLSPDTRRVVRWADAEARGDWLAAAVTTEAFFSFMSTIIVKRAFWQRGRMVPAFVGSCWAHVARFLELGQSGMELEYVPETWVAQRGENDSFRAAGLVARYALAVKGYSRLSKEFLRSQPGERAVRRCLRNEFSPSALAMARLLVAEFAETESKAQLNEVIELLYPRSERRTLPTKAMIKLVPLWLLRLVRIFWLARYPQSPFSRMWRVRTQAR